VFENRELRRIFGLKMEGVTEGWRKLCNEKVHNFYSSQKNVTMNKSRGMRWAKHVTRI
jgi:hypothetical protein